MIALLPAGVAKPSDENLPESVDNAKARRLRQKLPAVIGPRRMLRFQARDGRGGTE
jgi:hypothetical protein